MSIFLLLLAKSKSETKPPIGQSLWIEDESGAQMVTDSGEKYTFVTEE